MRRIVFEKPLWNFDTPFGVEESKCPVADRAVGICMSLLMASMELMSAILVAPLPKALDKTPLSERLIKAASDEEGFRCQALDKELEARVLMVLVVAVAFEKGLVARAGRNPDSSEANECDLGFLFRVELSG